MPAGREDVGKQDEVGFIGGAVGEREAVEVRVGDTEELRLTALVGAHGYVAVGSSSETTAFKT